MLGDLLQKFRHKKWVSSLYRTAQPNTLALFPTWGSQWELVVKDLPTAKIEKKSVFQELKCIYVV